MRSGADNQSVMSPSGSRVSLPWVKDVSPAKVITSGGSVVVAGRVVVTGRVVVATVVAGTVVIAGWVVVTGRVVVAGSVVGAGVVSGGEHAPNTRTPNTITYKFRIS